MKLLYLCWIHWIHFLYYRKKIFLTNFIKLDQMSLQLLETRGEGFIKQIAQKFDIHLKSFDADKNTQLRWIW